jgi:hypothetical protein
MMQPVQYVTQRPIVPLSEILEIIKSNQLDSAPLLSPAFTLLKNLQKRLYLYKSAEWAYEEEERIVARNENSTIFREEELASLIIGPFFSDEQLERLKSVAAKRKRPLKIFRSTISSSDYSLDVDWTSSPALQNT